MQNPQQVTPTEGGHVRFGKALGTRRKLNSSETQGAFALVEHDLPAHQLGSPVHTHEREDEYSYVLSGHLTAMVGETVIVAGPGETVVKPRGIPHAFWNAGSESVHFLEFITPGGFEEYFFELAAPFNARDAQAMGEIRARYHLNVELETIPMLLEKNALDPPF